MKKIEELFRNLKLKKNQDIFMHCINSDLKTVQVIAASNDIEIGNKSKNVLLVQIGIALLKNEINMGLHVSIIDKKYESLSVYKNKYAKICKDGKDINAARRTARELNIHVGKQTFNALCVQIGTKLKQLEVKKEIEKEKRRLQEQIRLQEEQRLKEEINEIETKMEDILSPCEDNNGKIFELTYMRPDLPRFPKWAQFYLNDNCVNIFDLKYLLSNKKLINVSSDIKSEINWYMDNIHKYVDKYELKAFLTRQNSIDEKAYQIQHFQSAIGILPSTHDPQRGMKLIKISNNPRFEPSLNENMFKFYNKFIQIYFDLPKEGYKPQKNELIIEIDNSVENIIKKCKKFVNDLCGGLSVVAKVPVYLQKSISDTHVSDDGIVLDTIGVTKTSCDGKSTFDDSHSTCSKIVIKSGLTKGAFSRTLVHELMHAELHERRSHPLILRSFPRPANDSKFEEGICVLTEFLFIGLKGDPFNKVFTRNGVTDEYFMRLKAEKLLSEFGHETYAEITDLKKYEYEKKYLSGFAHALNGMIKQKFTFEMLLTVYIKNGYFLL